MPSFVFDQAEGLRRMAAGVKPRIFTFLSTAKPDEKRGVLINLAASLMRVGSEVLVVDARCSGNGIVSYLGIRSVTSLLEVAQGIYSIEQAIHDAPTGFHYAVLTHNKTSAPIDGSALNAVFVQLPRHADVLLVDAELDAQGELPLSAMADSNIVVQVTPHQGSIKQAYLLVKQLHGQMGRRSFGVLVTGASEKDAQRVFANLAQTASRYLAVELRMIGAIPADEYMARAVGLERPVVEAFPLAAASVAFRQIASWFAQQDNGCGKPASWAGQDDALVLAGA